MRDPQQVGDISPLRKRNVGYFCKSRSRRVAARQRLNLPSPVPSMHSPSVIPKVRALALLGFLIALYLAALPSPAHAEPDPRAKPTNPVALEHFQSGNRLFRVREFDKAIAEYKAGAVLEDAPVFQYNLAQAYRMAGRHEEALWHYENFLGRLPQGDPNRTKVEELIAQVRSAQSLDAVKQKPESPASTIVAVGASAAVGSGPSHRSNPSPWYSDTTGWIVTGVGVASLSSALYLLLSANGLSNDALSEDRELQRKDLQDRARQRRLAGYVVGGLGLAVITVGSVKLAVHAEHAESVAVASVSMSGTF
jgi:tetratricopeptide (TPR) repeat protein